MKRTAVEDALVHFAFLYVGSSGPEGREGLPEEDGFRYILVIMDALSYFVSLDSAEACTAEISTCSIGARLWGYRVWVSDSATHFKNRVIVQRSDALKVDHRFSVAHTPWFNRTCERMVREVVRALKSILSEQRTQVAERVHVFQPLSGL